MEQYTLHPLSPRDVSCSSVHCTVLSQAGLRHLLKVHSTIPHHHRPIIHCSSQADNTLFLFGGVCSKYTLPYQYRPRMYCSCLEGLAQSTLYHIITGQQYSVFIWRVLPKVYPKIQFLSGGACPKYILPDHHRTTMLCFHLEGLAQIISYHTNTGRKYSFHLEGLAQSTSYHYQHWPKIHSFHLEGLAQSTSYHTITG